MVAVIGTVVQSHDIAAIVDLRRLREDSGTQHSFLMQLLEEVSAVLRRRFAGPAPERAVERGRVGEVQKVRDLADAQPRIAEVLEGEISANLVDQRGMGDALFGESPLQCPLRQVNGSGC
jgi:hypothetical protein